MPWSWYGKLTRPNNIIASYIRHEWISPNTHSKESSACAINRNINSKNIFGAPHHLICLTEPKGRKNLSVQADVSKPILYATVSWHTIYKTIKKNYKIFCNVYISKLRMLFSFWNDLFVASNMWVSQNSHSPNAWLTTGVMSLRIHSLS